MNQTRQYLVIFLIAICVLVIPISCSAFTNFFGEGRQVLQEELGPRAMLRKYEWFKDASATLEKYKADIIVYQNQIDSLKEDYEGVSRKDWDRVDKQTMSQWKQELAGVKAMYNRLAAKYNAQSNKVNWQYFDTTQGDLPPKSYQEM